MQADTPIPASTLLPIFAGEVHYPRIPPQYWQHRIQMIKALGLNALSVYIIWNYHEIQKGKFDFQNEGKNLYRFLQLAEKYQMAVLFRPGPYVCAQWDFGGLPARLLNVKGLEIRANNKLFLDETRIWFEALVPVLRKHMKTQSNKKGCIVMLQIQNQYGFYGVDKSYMQEIRKMWKQLEINLTQYYVDWVQNIHKCHWEGANIGINDFSKQQQEDTVRKFQKKGFLLGGQIYSGWMTHWTQKWGGKKTKKVLKDYEFLLSKNHSFAMYMVHGGTNFGLTAGANGLKDKPNDYWGAITSYDYDAPINEQGYPTPKYNSIRKLFLSHMKHPFPEPPLPIPMISIPQIKVSPVGNLLSLFKKNLKQKSKQIICHDLPSVFQSDQLQMYHQGIVAYQTQLEIGEGQQKGLELKIVVHDFGVAYLGERVIGVLDRTKNKQHKLEISRDDVEKYGKTLIILVEASGHINFDKNMLTDKKGLYSIEGLPASKWQMQKFQIDSLPFLSTSSTDQTFPTLYSSTFEIQAIGDTYLNVSHYGKGYLWINGHNLGRYWQVGPQKKLFCPGAWLKKGKNQIKIFNVYGRAGGNIIGEVKLYDTPIVYSQDQDEQPKQLGEGENEKIETQEEE